MAAVDRDIASGEYRIKRGDGKPWVDLTDAITDPPTLNLTMDGASTVTVPVNDADRRLLRDRYLKERSWLDVAGRRFELVRVSKQGSRVTLTFEDGVVGALRRKTAQLSIPPDTLSRAGVVGRLAREAGVAVVVDDSDSERVHAQVSRSMHGETENSWDLLGDLAQARNWRRFSDGKRLIVGPDSWLMTRDPSPTRLTEPVAGDQGNPVDSIDFDLDIGKPMAEATLSVDATRWALPAGSVVLLDDAMGAAAGKWLVWSFTRPVTRSRATVLLRRSQHQLVEPKATGAGDPGFDNYLPGQAGDAGSPGSGARERMVQFALAQSGKPYVWGASGPGSFDCSGLVQEATRAGGKVLPKPSAAQAARCSQAGRGISVAEGLRTRGALLFRIGTGATNHVAISLGNGSTVEARGRAYGCGVFGGAASHDWTSSALWI
ncbi:C40 family peptidase [Nocardioides sp. TRM66260-LWL]|uniref:C40 family peptidase n=1 Tax=Nocardioides sp. TRM66260-LWL TaxID=2874478 RepID=UPI001CC41503|nr:NlpC/P60 family protein [Nocardioides sp. TRM66260-LWL]MBZ5736498.1 C40 family peptidase [Nocardioides sp. TRM66260-LWL]